MDCNFTTIKTCELKDSTFRSRILDFGDFDISDYTFSAVYKAGFDQIISEQEITSVGNILTVPLEAIEGASNRAKVEVWMYKPGGFKDCVIVFDVVISATGCPSDASITDGVSVTFGGLKVPVVITQSIVNIFIDYESLTPEQKTELRFDWEDFTPENILELQQPATEAAALADIATAAANAATQSAQVATEEAQTATTAANEATADATTATTNANQAAGFANSATQEAAAATGEATAAASSANSAATAANAAAANAETKAQLADTAAINAQAKATLADSAAANANDKAGIAQTAATNADQKAAAAQTATNNANTATGNANTATTNANTATSAANAAAATANAARGWQPLLVADTTTIAGKTLLKLSDWIGGTGTKPTTNVGQWQTAAGGYTSTAASALDLNAVVTGDVVNRVSALEAITLNNTWYGVEWDLTVSNPLMTRIGNTALHQSLPIQSKMRRCLLKDDGTVNYYLDANDSTKKADGTAANLTGTGGQVMVEIPKHYRRFDTEGNKVRCLISENQLLGFHEVPKMYISAYQATVDRTIPATPKLASVVNLTTNFRGGDNNATWDAQSRTLLGRPASSIPLTNFRLYARNRGNAGRNGAGWNCYLYEAHKAIFWLYTVEYANRNSQAAYNASLDANGYRQGGLGNGVTNLNSTKWNAFNSLHPFVPMGHTNALGNKTGIVPFIMPAEYDAVLLTTNVPSYRGVENPFGHIWHWMDGVKVQIQAADAGGRSIFYTSLNPALFSDSGYTNYRETGDIMRANGYIKRMMIGEFGEIVPGESGAGSTTYWCDYGEHGNIPVSGESLRGLLWGGVANGDAAAGLGYSYSLDAPSNAYSRLGSRLTFLP